MSSESCASASCLSSFSRPPTPAGYRYGASDLAFYGPAVMRHLDPALFPRDRVVIDAQARLTLMDESVGTLARVTTRNFHVAVPGAVCRHAGAVRDRGRLDWRPPLSAPLEHGRAARGADSPPRDSEVGHEHARGLFPSQAARIRLRRPGGCRIPARPDCRRGAWLGRSRPAPPDDDVVVCDLAGRGDVRRYSAGIEFHLLSPLRRAG